MSVESNTAKTLKFSVYVSIAVTIIGLVINFAGLGQNVLWFGILLLILSPFAGVIVTTFSLYGEKDMKWVKVAVILIIISAIGMILK